MEVATSSSPATLTLEERDSMGGLVTIVDGSDMGAWEHKIHTRTKETQTMGQ